DSGHIKGTEDAALLIGQPLVGVGALSQEGHDFIVSRMVSWLSSQGITRVFYKAHPRDPAEEFKVPGAQVLNLEGSLENHMVTHRYRAVIGVNSTALYMARQLYDAQAAVVSFGQDLVHFKNADQGRKAAELMDALG